jgi:hypothetical protein
MPFPLAHPAAVLPLRRLCPRWFNFPGLVIGSLCPDMGYCFDQFHLSKFSHRFWAGGLGFCLPAGSLLLLLFYQLRGPVVRALPARFRRMVAPQCWRPAGPLLVMVISLLVGAWSHIILDSLTHGDGWLVKHLALLRAVVKAGPVQLRVCDGLYDLTTLIGVAWLALAYQHWLEEAAGSRIRIGSGFKWVASLLLAAIALLLSFANHNVSALGLVGIAVPTAGLVLLFAAAANWALREKPGCGQQSPEPRKTPSVGAQLSENQ